MDLSDIFSAPPGNKDWEHKMQEINYEIRIVHEKMLTLEEQLNYLYDKKKKHKSNAIIKEKYRKKEISPLNNILNGRRSRNFQ